jgi:hypothetical protein
MADMAVLMLLVTGVLSASNVAVDLTTIGPRKTVAKLVDGGDWTRAMAAISRGSHDWIELAPQLARGTDAAGAEGLDSALADALPIAAADVLAVIDLQRGPEIGVQRVCGVPFAATGTRDVEAYIASARAAIQAVPPLGLQSARQACLRELAAAEAEWMKKSP